MTGPTGILYMNMGGPRNVDEVEQFLTNVMLDEDIVKLPFQRYTGPLIARSQTKAWKRKYDLIGGSSPLLEWTIKQATATAEILDRERPQSAPHISVPCFRYSAPSTSEALQQMADMNVRNIIALSQYPQYSCTTTGASLHMLWDTVRAEGWSGQFTFSFIDRFGAHPSYIEALASTVTSGLHHFNEKDRNSVVVVFNVHTLPRAIINRNDAFLHEITTTVGLVQDHLGLPNPTVLGFAEAGKRDQGPSTADVIRGLSNQGLDTVLIIDVAFTSDHEETLYETDVELAEEARKAGIRIFRRAPALNDRPEYIRALVDIITEHLDGGRKSTTQFSLKCIGCNDPRCARIPDPADPKTASAETSGDGVP